MTLLAASKHLNNSGSSFPFSVSPPPLCPKIPRQTCCFQTSGPQIAQAHTSKSHRSTFQTSKGYYEGGTCNQIAPPLQPARGWFVHSAAPACTANLIHPHISLPEMTSCTSVPQLINNNCSYFDQMRAERKRICALTKCSMELKGTLISRCLEELFMQTRTTFQTL